MNKVLMNAILSMDSYNRGYDAAIIIPTVLNTTQIETATIITDSTTKLGNGVDSAIGFYALAYAYDKDADGVSDKTIISYRGTDHPVTEPKTLRLN